MSVLEHLDTIKRRIEQLLALNPHLMTATPNERLIGYWKMWDGFGDTAVDPTELTNYMSIDRAFRLVMPSCVKNYSKEAQYREELGNEVQRR